MSAIEPGDLGDAVSHREFDRGGQLLAATYVMLALSVAAFGFQIVFVLNEEFDPADPLQKWALIAALLSLFVLFMSVIFGLLLVMNHIRKIRAATLAVTAAPDDLRLVQRHRRLSAKLERRSWHIFWYQLGTFGFGLFLTAIAVALQVIASFLSYGQTPGCDI
jgi:hypothetical protein